MLRVARPIEAYPKKGTYLWYDDLDRDDVYFNLLWGTECGLYSSFHFGIPCKSWGRANRLNKGTRRSHCPNGGPGILPRELLGNLQAKRAVALFIACSRHGVLFTCENPSDSAIWKCKSFVELSLHMTCFFVAFENGRSWEKGDQQIIQIQTKSIQIED